MPRLMGVDIPGKKRIEYSLRYIHGIGPARSKMVLEKAGIDPAKKADDLTADEIRQIIGIIQESFHVEGDLRREVAQNIRRLISTGSYRGTRHRKGSRSAGSAPRRTRAPARAASAPSWAEAPPRPSFARSRYL